MHRTDKYKKNCAENLKRRDHSKYLGVGGKVNIRMDLRDIEWEVVDLIYACEDMNQWGGGGSCEHSRKHSDSEICGELLQKLRN
jgi:hypothetical protein